MIILMTHLISDVLVVWVLVFAMIIMLLACTVAIDYHTSKRMENEEKEKLKITKWAKSKNKLGRVDNLISMLYKCFKLLCTEKNNI